jgi:hypothetical protein
MAWTNWFFWLTAAALCLGALLGHALDLRRWVVISLALITFGATLMGFQLSSGTLKPSPTDVRITVPVSGLHLVGRTLLVEGVVKPPGSTIALAIRSERDTYWWIQPVVKTSTQERIEAHWSIRATFGTADAGIGENFQIIALASADGRWFDLIAGRALAEGSRFRELPNWHQSMPVVVWRAQ